MIPGDVASLVLGDNAPLSARQELTRELGLDKPFWLRYVLVPGYSDAEADIRALGERLGGYKQVERVEILPYHTLGVHKYEAMGKEYRLAGVQENTPEQSERAAARFREYFPTVVVN